MRPAHALRRAPGRSGPGFACALAPAPIGEKTPRSIRHPVVLASSLPSPRRRSSSVRKESENDTISNPALTHTLPDRSWEGEEFRLFALPLLFRAVRVSKAVASLPVGGFAPPRSVAGSLRSGAQSSLAADGVRMLSGREVVCPRCAHGESRSCCSPRSRRSRSRSRSRRGSRTRVSRTSRSVARSSRTGRS